jgi:hypothetical protein
MASMNGFVPAAIISAVAACIMAEKAAERLLARLGDVVAESFEDGVLGEILASLGYLLVFSVELLITGLCVRVDRCSRQHTNEGPGR